jgi:hypothetical protein
LAAHSLGCTFVSWMLKHPIACRRVSATVLIDPVTFLLCDPTVATTVVYKEPASTIDFLMHFFVARELFIANALSRHFSWSQNILFVEDLSAVDAKDTNAYSSYDPSRDLADTATNATDSDSGGSVDSSDAQVPSLQIRHTVSMKYTCALSNTCNYLDLLFQILVSLQDSIIPVGSVLRYLQAKSKQGHTCFEVSHL